MSHCSHCDSLLQTALEASRAYHDLLADLEAAHIRHDTDLTFRIHEQVAEALSNRDAAVAAISEHARTHARGTSSGQS